ncbi:SCO3242 family prenyltransferase [Streptomyces sp. NPDC059698]|uniref:SCO3242 family prenyltransferase n=3 Tax=Streptomyces TaxID=1883 RepID=UPI0009628645|nr:prenyltransferase [Streptomyces sp. CB02366]
MRRRPRLLPAALALVLPAVPDGRRNGYAHGVGKPAVAEDRLSGASGTAPAPDRPAPAPAGRNGERGAEAGTVRGGGSDRGAGPGSKRLGAGAGGDPAPDRATTRERLRAWAELLRVSALFSVPGDALAGAAAAGRRPGRSTALAIGASLCLYEAGMALNDWADRDEDAVDRPHRPIPSGRVSPAAALGAAGALTAAGLALAARAGRPALTVAAGLATTVWAYDLRLKHTKAGPAAMAAARSLDLLLGATATVAEGAAPAGTTRGGSPLDNVAGRGRATSKAAPLRDAWAAALPALPAALVLGAHTYGVTAVSRHEARGGSTGTPLAVLATTTVLAAAVLGEWRWRDPASGSPRPTGPATGTTRATAGTVCAVPDADPTGAGLPPAGAHPAHARPAPRPGGPRPADPGTGSARSARLRDLLGHAAGPDRLRDLLGRAAARPDRLLAIGFTAAYLRTAGPPLLHAALNPSPPLTRRAVGGGIRAMIPLQAALAARAGSPSTGLALMGLVPLARSLARKVSPT